MKDKKKQKDQYEELKKLQKENLPKEFFILLNKSVKPKEEEKRNRA